MKGVNKVILVGTLGRDPESRTFDNGNSVCNFSIATSEQWKDKNTGEPVENTEWHRIQASGKLAEICQQYLKKGSKVYIEGSLKTREYESEGTKKQITEIRATQMQMLGDKPRSDTQSEPDASYSRSGIASDGLPQVLPVSQQRYNSNQDLDDILPF